MQTNWSNIRTICRAQCIGEPKIWIRAIACVWYVNNVASRQCVAVSTIRTIAPVTLTPILLCSESNAISICCFREWNMNVWQSEKSSIGCIARRMWRACLFTLYLCIYSIKLILERKNRNALEDTWKLLGIRYLCAAVWRSLCAPLCIFHFSFSGSLSHTHTHWLNDNAEHIVHFSHFFDNPLRLILFYSHHSMYLYRVREIIWLDSFTLAFAVRSLLLFFLLFIFFRLFGYLFIHDPHPLHHYYYYYYFRRFVNLNLHASVLCAYENVIWRYAMMHGTCNVV